MFSFDALPGASATWVYLPDSERTNAPPTYILYALRTERRTASPAASSVLVISPARGPPFFAAISVHLEVGEEPLAPALAAKAALFVAAEGRARIELVVGVGPDDAGAEALRHPEALGALVGPDPSGEAVHGVVGLLHGLLRGAEGEHREHRSAALLAGAPVRRRDAGEDRRREPEAPIGDGARGAEARGALALARGHQLADLVELH